MRAVEEAITAGSGLSALVANVWLEEVKGLQKGSSVLPASIGELG